MNPIRFASDCTERTWIGSRVRSLCTLAIAMTLLFCCNILSVHAQLEEANVGSLARRYADFNVTIYLSTVAGNGYQPGRIVFTPVAGRFKTNRSFEIKIGPRLQRDHELLYDANFSCEAIQGDVEASVPILLPSFYQTEALRVNVYENGRIADIPNCLVNVNSIRVQDTDQFTSIAILQPKDVATQDQPWKVFPDVRTLSTVFEGPVPTDNQVKRLSHKAAMDLISSTALPSAAQFRIVSEESLPTNWLFYSQLDVILVAAPLLARIEVEQPQAFETIKDYLATGGTLWVYAAEKSESKFLSSMNLKPMSPQVALTEKLTRDRLKLSERNDTSPITYQYWNGVQRGSMQSGTNNFPFRSDEFKLLKEKEHPFTEFVPANKLLSSVMQARFGYGQVITISDSDPFPGSAQFWMSIVEGSGSSHIAWEKRTGLPLTVGNGSFWDQLVPGVGTPPLKTFLLLNALFAITLGPVCYTYFRRKDRLYLLYFIAPTTALVVAFALFVYALIADGLSTKGRIQQITWLDTTNGVGVRECHESYVAALPSRKGLTYSDQAAVYPVTDFNSNVFRYRGYNIPSQKQIHFEKGQYRFSGDFLPSRSQIQFKTFTPIKEELQIEFDESVTPPQVTNRREYEIETAFLKDKGGKIWLAQNLTPNVATAMTSFSPQDHAEVAERIWPYEPSVALHRSNTRTSVFGLSPFASNSGSVSLLTEQYRAFLTSSPARSFLIVVPVQQESTGLPEAKLIDGIHILMGILP